MQASTMTRTTTENRAPKKAPGRMTSPLTVAEKPRTHGHEHHEAICTMELTALKYKSKTSTATDEKFFGSWSQFKKGILKEMEKESL